MLVNFGNEFAATFWNEFEFYGTKLWVQGGRQLSAAIGWR